MTPDLPALLADPEPGDAMPRHDLGCKCWPHVSEKDAFRLIADVSYAEYRQGKSDSAALLAEVERLRAVVDAAQALSDFLETERATYDGVEGHFRPMACSPIEDETRLEDFGDRLRAALTVATTPDQEGATDDR